VAMAPSVPALSERGLVLLALLIMLVLLGISALAAAEVWATTVKRERESELLFIGEQYRRAIAEYWRMSPGRRAYPPSVEALLTDDRFPNPVHHLRRTYRDPMTETGEFEVIKQGNGVVGIHSTSDQVPIKHGGFKQQYAQFEQAETYAQWQFIFVPAGFSNMPDTGQGTPGATLPPPPMTPSQGPAPGVPLPQVPPGR
jgi:type II secretory pathway pseudopilin PulG